MKKHIELQKYLIGVIANGDDLRTYYYEYDKGTVILC